MKSLAGLLLGILIGAVAVPYAFGEHPPTRPPGVPADHWVPINEQLGVVLVSPPSLPPADAKPQVQIGPQPLLVEPASDGYFMVRRGDVWRRLSVAERPGDAW